MFWRINLYIYTTFCLNKISLMGVKKMGVGTAIAGLGAAVGIALIIIGALISLTGIGALIGIPLIVVGLAAIFGGMAGGATVGTAKGAYKASKAVARRHSEDKTDEDIWECRYCGQEYSSKRNLARHEKVCNKK